MKELGAQLVLMLTGSKIFLIDVEHHPCFKSIWNIIHVSNYRVPRMPGLWLCTCTQQPVIFHERKLYEMCSHTNLIKCLEACWWFLYLYLQFFYYYYYSKDILLDTTVWQSFVVVVVEVDVDLFTSSVKMGVFIRGLVQKAWQFKIR